MPPADRDPVTGTSRPLPRALLLLAAALLVARVGTGLWEERHRPPVAAPAATPGTAAGAERVAWVPIDRAEDESRRAHKPVLYEFSAEWCGPCRAMSREVFADSADAARIAAWYVPVRVLDRVREEGRNPPAVERLQDAYHVEAFPTLVVTWPGTSEYRRTEGYGGADGTMAWLAGNAARTRFRVVHGPMDSTAARP